MSAGRTPADRRAALARGARAEQHVCDDLRRDGWVVLGQNVHLGGGELDAVVLHPDGRLRFLEVKARSDDDGAPVDVLDSLHAHKRDRLVSAADAWLQGYDGAYTEACFLVALVDLADDGQHLIDYIDDAFDG